MHRSRPSSTKFCASSGLARREAVHRAEAAPDLRFPRMIVGEAAGIMHCGSHEPAANAVVEPMHWIFRPSIRRKIVGIAVGLIVLMVLTSVLSVVMEST